MGNRSIPRLPNPHTRDPRPDTRPHDPEYIVRLIGQVITVSLETVKLVAELATLTIDQA